MNLWYLYKKFTMASKNFVAELEKNEGWLQNWKFKAEKKKAEKKR